MCVRSFQTQISACEHVCRHVYRHVRALVLGTDPCVATIGLCLICSCTSLHMSLRMCIHMRIHMPIDVHACSRKFRLINKHLHTHAHMHARAPCTYAHTRARMYVMCMMFRSKHMAVGESPVSSTRYRSPIFFCAGMRIDVYAHRRLYRHAAPICASTCACLELHFFCVFSSCL